MVRIQWIQIEDDGWLLAGSDKVVTIVKIQVRIIPCIALAMILWSDTELFDITRFVGGVT